MFMSRLIKVLHLVNLMLNGSILDFTSSTNLLSPHLSFVGEPQAGSKFQDEG